MDDLYQLPYLIRLYRQGNDFQDEFTSADDNFQPDGYRIMPLVAQRARVATIPGSVIDRLLQVERISPNSRARFPSRLLHQGVSHETKYMDHCPPYTVISYTWGRWKLDDTPGTSLPGIDWPVPDTGLFTRAELDSAVGKIGRETHVWLDVFCIPQDDKNPEMEEEIQKQGEIFTNAAVAAVWLCSGGDDVLTEVCSWTDHVEDSVSVRVSPTRVFNPTTSSFSAETLDLFRRLADFTDKVPWASSLWTLQESALRRDAIFYNKAGNCITSRVTGRPLRILDLIRSLTLVEGELTAALEHMDLMKPEDMSLLLAAWDGSRKIALGRLETKNSLELLHASRQRTSTRPQDMFYGIMNALGISIPVDYSLPEAAVRRQFTLAALNMYPAEIQGFVQVYAAPKLGWSWQPRDRYYSLSALRQDLQSPGSQSVFFDVGPTGCLFARGGMSVDSERLEWICLELIGGTAAICYDILEDPMHPQLKTPEDEQSATAANLRHFAAASGVVVVPLGRALPTSRLGGTFVYLVSLILGRSEINAIDDDSAYPSSEAQAVRRAGLLVTSKAVPRYSATEQEAEFSIW